MKIALDAMGSDNAPIVEVEAAVKASRTYPDIEIVLVGDEQLIVAELAKHSYEKGSISIVHAATVIGMHEQPTVALRTKKDSSIVVAIRLHKEGVVQGVISAGNTGAVVAASLLGLGRIKGVHRPAIAVLFPTHKGQCALLDCGANVDCKPNQLVQYAHMGAIYAEHLLQSVNPRVGLINVGEEKSKGNELIQKSYQLLQETDLNFIGNIEGSDVLTHGADVVVCDGFVGNIMLKFGESMVPVLKSFLKTRIFSSLRYKIGALFMKPLGMDFARTFDYEQYGGASLLGVDGTIIISHGSSSATAMANGIGSATTLIKENINGLIRERLETGKENA